MPKEEFVKIIDLVHSFAHSDALDNVDEDVITSMTDFFRTFLEVKVTPKQACDILDTPAHTINNIVYRKVPKSERYKTYWMMKLSSIIDYMK